MSLRGVLDDSFGDGRICRLVFSGCSFPPDVDV
jgi:hypothetical protein